MWSQCQCIGNTYSSMGNWYEKSKKSKNSKLPTHTHTRTYMHVHTHKMEEGKNEERKGRNEERKGKSKKPLKQSKLPILIHQSWSSYLPCLPGRLSTLFVFVIKKGFICMEWTYLNILLISFISFKLGFLESPAYPWCWKKVLIQKKKKKRDI